MKAVLISIRPKWVELIASGKKTVEIRKSRPKLETPFKCYIYETKGKVESPRGDEDGYVYQEGRGAVVGEFVCDTLVKDNTCGRDNLFNGAACVAQVTATGYASGKLLYGWHISALKMYEEPRKLSEFRSYNTLIDFEQGYPMPTHGIRRPPQSYMYVEELYNV